MYDNDLTVRDCTKIKHNCHKVEQDRAWFLSLFNRHSLEPYGVKPNFPAPETIIDHETETQDNQESDLHCSQCV